MKSLTIILVFLLLTVSTSSAAPPAPQRMRPYTGIGILLLPDAGENLFDPLPLYEEPGLSRLGSLTLDNIPRYDWIFGTTTAVTPLVVTGRKGPWLRIAYDDAGREAWINPSLPGAFQSWDYYLKNHVIRLLPGLQKKYYQLFQLPDKALLAPFMSGQFFKVLQLENDWVMVLTDQNMLGWLRWRDEDGRLLIGVISAPHVMQP